MGDVCLCNGPIELLARMRLAQLRLEHKEDRVVPEGTPDALRSIWGDKAALADFLRIGARPPVAPGAYPVPHAHPPAADVAFPVPNAQPPAAPAAFLVPGAQPPAAPVAVAPPPAARVADAVLVAELEALRERCAELEARLEQLDSSDERAAVDAFDFVARLAALEGIAHQSGQPWMKQLADNTEWQ